MVQAPTRLRCASLAGATACVAVGVFSGCGLSLGGAGAMDAQSILTLLPAPPSPAEAAQWAIDPYDADKRQRGVLLLANAP
ncbi:MAG: hypothetical protein D6824_03150, partial [Planctomycetota bacterium]